MTQDTGFGQIDFTRYFVIVDDTQYLALYADLTPANLETYSADELVTFAAEHLIERTSGNLLYDRVISLDGAPGREIKIETLAGRIAQIRVYQVGRRQYQIGVFSAPEDEASPDILRFIESLQVIR